MACATRTLSHDAPNDRNPAGRPPPRWPAGPAPTSRLAAVLASGVLLLTVAACGSSGSETPPPNRRGSSTGSSAPSGATGSSTDVGGVVPTGFEPASVTFVSADQGFVLGTAPCSTPPCPGGHRRRRLELAPACPLPRPAGHRHSGTRSGDGADRPVERPCGSATTWTAGRSARLWSTHDGGGHWSEQHLEGAVTDLASADGVTYAVVTSCPSGSCEQGATLYRTDASTDEWQRGRRVSLPPEGGRRAARPRRLVRRSLHRPTVGAPRSSSSTDGTAWTRSTICAPPTTRASTAWRPSTPPICSCCA